MRIRVPKISPFTLRVIACVALLLVFAVDPALAQPQQEVPKPPFDVQGLKHERVWVPWICVFLFIAAAVAIGMKNPRRSHLD